MSAGIIYFIKLKRKTQTKQAKQNLKTQLKPQQKTPNPTVQLKMYLVDRDVGWVITVKAVIQANLEDMLSLSMSLKWACSNAWEERLVSSQSNQA